MEQIHEFWAEINELDRRQVISLYWLKRWSVSLAFVFLFVNYIWTSIFSGMRDTHIPFALLPQELQLKEIKMNHRTESELLSFQINQVNFVVFACSPLGAKSYDTSNEDITVIIESIRTMKSATLFTKKVIHFHIFTEDRLYPEFLARIDRWPNNILHRVTFQFHPATYPESILDNTAKNEALQKACDLSFLFVPSIVKNLDFVIYAKSGTVFLNPIDELWMNFRDYSGQNSIALPFHTNNGICQNIDSSFSNQIYHVYDMTVIEYDIRRLQTGLFKVPFARKKEFANKSVFPLCIDEYEIKNMTWNPTMLLTIYKFFKLHLTSHGIDLLNIIAFFNPDKIYSLSCEWNFDADICKYQFGISYLKAKLLKNFEDNGVCSLNLNYEKIISYFDNLDLKNINMTDVHIALEDLQQQIIGNWYIHKHCLLKI